MPDTFCTQWLCSGSWKAAKWTELWILTQHDDRFEPADSRFHLMLVSFKVFFRLISLWHLWLSVWCFALMQVWAGMAMLNVHVGKSFNLSCDHCSSWLTHSHSPVGGKWTLQVDSDSLSPLQWHMTMTKSNLRQSNNERKVENSPNLSQLLVDEALAKLYDPNYISWTSQTERIPSNVSWFLPIHPIEKQNGDKKCSTSPYASGPEDSGDQFVLE